MTIAPGASTNQITRWVLVSFAIILIVTAMWFVRDILLLTVTAVIMAILLTTPIRFMVMRGVPRPLAILLTLVILVVVVILAGLVLLPGLFSQFQQLISIYLPGAAKELQNQLQPDNLQARFTFLKDLDPKTLDNLSNQVRTQLLDGLGNIPAQIFPFVGGLASTLLNILIVVFLAMYFVADPDLHERGLVKMVPLRYRGRAFEILIKLDSTLRKFLQAQIVLMLLIGGVTGAALAVLGVPLAGALGTITGLLAFIPNFGPLVALIPIIAVALINTPNQLLLVVVVFYVVQFLMSQLLAPVLMGREVNLPPSLILLSQIIAGIFFGFLGLLLSVPLAAIATVLVREIYIKDILGDEKPQESLSQMVQDAERA